VARAREERIPLASTEPPGSRRDARRGAESAIKDQETAGIDIVSDGEAQRDNMIDYFTERMPGVQVDLGSKRFYYDFYESVVRSKLATGTLGVAEEAKFLGKFTTHVSKISVSGPHTLVKRIQNKHYPTKKRSRSISAACSTSS
jgi:5-methyltetrahydropteroyltriglutamate--homocysteine methyltransferase